MSHSLPMILWCKSSVCAVYFCPADWSCCLCGASEVTSPVSGWWTYSLFCWLLSLCPVSSPASWCFIFYQTTSTDGQSVIPENFPDDCLSHFLLWFISPFILSGCTGQSMESIPSSSVVKKPGETLSLSCRGSGFTFSCCVMSWIRQPAGKPLEMIGIVFSNASSNTCASCLSGRVEISRYDSNSMVHLRLKNLKPEDSAVHHCAKENIHWLK